MEDTDAIFLRYDQSTQHYDLFCDTPRIDLSFSVPQKLLLGVVDSSQSSPPPSHLSCLLPDGCSNNVHVDPFHTDNPILVEPNITEPSQLLIQR